MKNRVKPFVDGLGITVYEFRAKTGIANKTAYDLYNNPGQYPSKNVMEKICSTFKVQPGELVEWVDDSPSGGGKGGKDAIATEPSFEIGDCIKNPRGERGYVLGFDGDRVMVDMEASGSDSYPAHLLELVHKGVAAA